MKKFVLAPALAALAMFVLGGLYWMSPFPYKVLTPVGDNAAAAAALAKIFSSTGTYLVPGPEMTDQKQLAELYEHGPSVEIQYVREGHTMMEAGVFIKGYLHYFVTALLLAFLLEKSAPSFKGFSCRVKFSVMVGVVGAVFINLSDPIWWHHPWGFHLMRALYAVLAFTIGGLVLAKFLTPKAAA